jgi:hypothetical protein
MALRLRANTRNDSQTANRLLGTERDKLAAEAVVIAAFELAIRRRFPAGSNQREVAAFAAHLMQKYRPERIRTVDVEAAIRAVLDDDVSVDGIDYRTLTMTRLLATSEALAQLQLSDRELDALLYAAEQLAVARGFHPDPA